MGSIPVDYSMYVDFLKNIRLSAPRMGWTLKSGMLLKTIRPGEFQDRTPDVRVLRVSRPTDKKERYGETAQVTGRILHHAGSGRWR